MDNLEWLKNVKKADGDVDKAIRKAKSGLFIDDKTIGKVIIEYRKIKALEIIAESLINIDINLNILTAVIENADVRNLKY